MSNVTSNEIKLALSKKHITEFFLSEVKSGSSSGSWMQMDAVAMYKSWVNQRIVAYEIKVSRSDFLRDSKINQYLKYCHELVIICPHGMIQPAEVPIEYGLMYYNPTTKNITTKRKPIFRRIDVDADMLYYIIMYRLQSDRYPFHGSKKEYFKEWLVEKEERKNIGIKVSGALPDEISRLNTELLRLKNIGEQSQLVEDIKNVMRKHGIDVWRKDKIPEMLDANLSRNYPMEIDLIEKDLEYSLKIIREIKEKKKLER